MTGSGSGVLPVRRSRRTVLGDRAGVIVDVDATGDERALAVLQAPLLPAPEEDWRLVFGYDVVPAGLGLVGDRRLRIRLWPAFVDGTVVVVADDHDDPDSDVCAIDVDPVAQADVIDGLIETGRLIIAGPDLGPRPVVVDVDPDLVREVRDQL